MVRGIFSSRNDIFKGLCFTAALSDRKARPAKPMDCHTQGAWCLTTDPPKAYITNQSVIKIAT